MTCFSRGNIELHRLLESYYSLHVHSRLEVWDSSLWQQTAPELRAAPEPRANLTVLSSDMYKLVYEILGTYK